jgi:hypothetical protein
VNLYFRFKIIISQYIKNRQESGSERDGMGRDRDVRNTRLEAVRVSRRYEI